jgi:hypothetical protein
MVNGGSWIVGAEFLDRIYGIYGIQFGSGFAGLIRALLGEVRTCQRDSREPLQSRGMKPSQSASRAACPIHHSRITIHLPRAHRG